MDHEVRNNSEEGQFELAVDGHTAVLEYSTGPGRITLTHTDVPDALAGRGIGGKLAKAALEHARENDLKVAPFCSFVAGYIRKHPEYRDLVGEEFREMVT